MEDRHKAAFVLVPRMEAAGNHRESGMQPAWDLSLCGVERAVNMPLRKCIESRCVDCGRGTCRHQR